MSPRSLCWVWEEKGVTGWEGGTGAWLRSVRCGPPQVPAPLCSAAAASGETEGGDAQPHPAPFCSGSDPPVPGCRSPGLKLCLRLRSEPLLRGPRTHSGLPGPQFTTPGWGRQGAGSSRGTQGSAAERRARHAAPGAPGTSSAPLRAQWRLALTGSKSQPPLALSQDARMLRSVASAPGRSFPAS